MTRRVLEAFRGGGGDGDGLLYAARGLSDEARAALSAAGVGLRHGGASGGAQMSPSRFGGNGYYDDGADVNAERDDEDDADAERGGGASVGSFTGGPRAAAQLARRGSLLEVRSSDDVARISIASLHNY